VKILITGGTGLIGRRLCRALLARGDQLTVLSRSPARVAQHCGVAVEAWTSLQQWSPELAFDAVINLAGEPIADARWTARRRRQLLDSRVALSEQLLQRIAAAQHKPAVLLSGSAIGYYGDRDDVDCDEQAPPGHDFAAQLCQRWEQVALRAADFGTRVCLLRTGLVLDADGGLLKKMLLPFQLGLGSRLGNGRQWMSWIHAEDHLALLLRLLDDTQAFGAYNLTAPQPVRNSEFTQRLAASLHRRAVMVAPAFMLRLLLGEMAILLLGGQHVLPQRFAQAGHVFRYPSLDLALAALLRR